MIKLAEYPRVQFLNFEDENDVKKFIDGDGINEPNPLYKYVPWTFAKKSLTDRYLWMSNPSVWNDPFEDYFLAAKYVDSTGNSMDFPFKHKVFCNCLTFDHNSESHWITYSKRKIGVSLRINVKELINQLNSFGQANQNLRIFVGKVIYLKQSEIQKERLKDIPLFEDAKGRHVNRDINNPELCANLLLLKRRSFNHDNEVRLIIIQDKEELDGIKFQYNYDNYGHPIPNYPNEKLVNRVFTSPFPFHGVKVRDRIRKELEKKKYGLSPYSVNRKTGKVVLYSRIQRSRLYDKVKSQKIYL